ncbi:hypothetical protein IQ255_07680 [Pleurocapsales cyanobacterium LEGE 10410]|nr:hypothetical protein [Pleurocapsales cyanobacterium LEGE 10410]
MKKISWKTLVTTLIGTGIASSLVALPVKANEESLVDNTAQAELFLGQLSYGDRNFNNAEPSDGFKNLVGLTGLAIGTGVVGYHLTRAYKPSLVNSLPTISSSNSNAALIDRVSPKLRKELLRLVHNKATASRLLSGTLVSHPGRSPNWVAEKVIYDLKRDR